MSKKQDLTGKQFGRLRVIAEHSQRSKSGKARWICQCACGRWKIITGSFLTRSQDNIRSCGCLRAEKSGQRGKIHLTTHGMNRTPVHVSWERMMQRCTDLNCPDYLYYGGRGITVCDRWKLFENFYADMGNRPKGHTLDRIDNSEGYYPENCKWSTPKEQAANRRKPQKQKLGRYE